MRYIFLVMILTGAVFAQQPLDKIAVIIDDDIILWSEITQAAYLYAMQMEIDPVKNQKEFKKIQEQTLQDLINQRLLLIQADKDTIEADENQVEMYTQQQMQNVIQQLGGEEKTEAYFGTTLSKIRRNYREEIEKNFRISAVRDQKLADVTVTRREIREFYKAKKDSIGMLPETVDISHILIEVQPGEEARQETLSKIKEIRQKILAGGDFEKLAKEFSQDPGSAARGGDLGFMSRGDFVRPFEEAAFSLQQGEISEVVETEFGFHIIKLEEKRGDRIHCRHILLPIEPTREDEVEAAEKIKSIYKMLQNGEDFVELVEKYSEDVNTIQQKGYLGTFQMEELKSRAKEFTYALDGIGPGEYSDPVRTKFGFHILMLNSRQESRELDWEKDRDKIENMALEYKKQQVYKEWIKELEKNVYIEIKPLREI